MCLLASGQLPVEGGLTESPGKKGWHKGPRPNWHHAAHISAKPAASIFLFSLEASITCNSLQLLYIKTIKYDLRYKLTSTRPHIT